MSDGWCLRGKEKMIAEGNIGFDDAVDGYAECYLIEDIDVLRRKLIEDVEHRRKFAHDGFGKVLGGRWKSIDMLFDLMIADINKRFVPSFL